MKIGYPCINRTIGCSSSRTFRLKSYSEDRLIDTVSDNLACLFKILQFNVVHDLLFFRISSDLVPFASHSICKLDWRSYFRDEFIAIGSIVKKYGIRISMHPGQYTVLNTTRESTLHSSIAELLYHAQLLDAIELDLSAKIQIHIGGLYGNKAKSMMRFVECYNRIPEIIRKRLVIENDDSNYTLQDCIRIHADTGIPVLFDTLHHRLNNCGEDVEEAIALFTKTWKGHDGVPMVDYSHNKVGKQGSHAETINIRLFSQFLRQTHPHDLDIMLEIKDKEISAIKSIKLARQDKRFLPNRALANILANDRV